MSDPNQPTPEDPEPIYLDDDDSLPQIDNYRILQRVGEGGMGEVYEAEQHEPVRRRVAIKVIKHGMDTKQVVMRFESERQALALMNHPSIARVYDAGATRRGRPYFAMEYVRGKPIIEYCDRYRLDTDQRLELFVEVCRGIQHAHQKGVIHRDIKPSNVLIQVEGDRAVPKIIDFGISKAVEQRLTERTAFTEMGQLVGTPEYMSPEQAGTTVHDIDTRTDVYSLGVLLYELLVGALPFDPDRMREKGFEEFRRSICEDDPSAPSARLSALLERAEPSAHNRRTDPGALLKRVRGDLDWITLKALEKDRTRRYGSPAELAADIERHLRNEPVQARPPSTAYRLGKFVKRHKVGVVACSALLLLLVAFTVAMTLQAARIAQQRDRANQEAEAATQVALVLNELFDLADPGEALGSSVTARELLDIGLQKVRGSLADQPRELAQSLGVIGDSYRGLGLYDKAQPLLGEALESRRRLLGDDDPDTLSSMRDLAVLYVDQGRYDEAERLLLGALEGRRDRLGATHPDTLDSMNDLAGLYRKQGRHDEAETYYLQTLEARRTLLGADHKDTTQTMNDLAGLYWDQGRHDKAEALYLETLNARRRLLGRDHKDTAETLNDLGVLYWDRGDYDKAEPLYLEALEIRRRVLSENHPDTLVAMSNLALLYDSQGRYDEAEPLYLEVLEVQRRVLGDEHPQTLTAMNNLAGLYWSQKRYDEAEPLWVGVLAGLRGSLGEQHPHTLGAMGNLGELYMERGRLAEAEALLSRAIAGARRSLGPDHPITGVTTRKYGRCLTALGRYDEADEELRKAYRVLVAAFGEDHSQTAKVVRDLVELYEAWGNPGRASEWRSKLPASNG